MIFAQAGADLVPPPLARDPIIARTALEEVVPTATLEMVVAATAGDTVVSAQSVDIVGPGRSEYVVIARRAGDRKRLQPDGADRMEGSFCRSGVVQFDDRIQE
ncbi:MAG: hypothetical protein KDK53_20720 [Maritimibacter sp.]|nr:hypothetical protein [Maritimibacter sp.]